MGGVAVIAILSLAFWFFAIRRKKNRSGASPEEPYYPPLGPAEADGKQYQPVRTEVPGDMAGNFGVSEVGEDEMALERERKYKYAAKPVTELP